MIGLMSIEELLMLTGYVRIRLDSLVTINSNLSFLHVYKLLLMNMSIRLFRSLCSVKHSLDTWAINKTLRLKGGTVLAGLDHVQRHKLSLA